MSQITHTPPQPTTLATASPTRAAGGPADEPSLIHILWRRRRIVGTCALLALATGVLYLALARPTYTAVSRLFIEAAGGKKAGQDAADRVAFLYTQREVITSTPVLATALGRPGFLEFETFAKKRDAITALRNDMSVEVGKKDDLVSITLDSRYPNEATQLVAAVADAYVRFQVTQRTALTADTLVALEYEKARTENEVAERTEKLQAFSMEHRISGSEVNAGNADNDALRAIAASLTKAHLDVLSSTARLPEATPDKAVNSPADSEADYTAEDEAAVRHELTVAENTLEVMNSKYVSGNRMVTAAKAQVDRLKAKRHAVLRSIQRAAVKHEAELQAYYDAEQRRQIEQRAFAAEYTRMNGERLRLQERVDAIDTRLRDLRVSDENKMATVSVLEPAHTDALATGPKKAKTLAIALAAGLLLGLAGALAWDQIDSRVESIDRLNRLLGLASLGTLPGLPAGGSAVARALYTYSEPNSPFAAACRHIWRSIHAANHGVALRSVAVTSASPGDGRTTTACGLAIAMAQHGRRVLLIDGDAGSPGLCALLGVDPGTGLGDMLHAASIDAERLRQSSRPTVVPKLYLLGGGRMDSVDHPNLSALLEVSSREFDVVIVDTPAARKNAAYRVVAANCQATLMVVRLGHTDTFAASRLRTDLYKVGADVLGVVTNTALAAHRGPAVTVDACRPVPLAGPRDALGLAGTDAQVVPVSRSAGELSVAS